MKEKEALKIFEETKAIITGSHIVYTSGMGSSSLSSLCLPTSDNGGICWRGENSDCRGKRRKPDNKSVW